MVLANMKLNRRVALCGAVMFCTMALAVAQTAAGNRPSDAQTSLDIQTRAKTYLDLRKNVAGNSSRQGDSPSAIASAQSEMANKIRVARAGVKQGNIFSPRIADYVRKQIAKALAGPHGRDIRASLDRSEPVNIQLQINQSYPDNVPLQSTPASLLLNLPELPKGLEYRLLGSELVLRDADANIVVDYILHALPN
jgi:hypothetical protein